MERTELESAPSLAGLYARAVGSLLPGGGDELPQRELVLRGAELEADHVAAYARVCGFGIRDTAPGTFPHVLAFPLHLRLMSERSFPFSVLGLIHIANRIEILAPLPVGSSLDLSVRAAELRPHGRGRQFDLVAEGKLEGRAVWRGRSTYLHREGNGSEDGEASPEGGSDAAELSVSAEWRIPGDTGRRYAGVSGDRNPIHMHSLSARAFGFPTAIAHGMWTKARCLAAFEGRLPDAYAIEVEFKAPLRIPGSALFLTGRDETGWQFAVESPDRERIHARGSIA
jgi:acyl dehydratase